MNYLVLTPEGVGSTYLQTAITLHLNSAGYKYYNTHELLTGVSVYKNALVKDPIDYEQPLKQLCELIQNNTAPTVSRIAMLHVRGRQTELGDEDYRQLYTVCNSHYHKKLYCVRDPFEYALSWSIRNITGEANIFEIKHRTLHHNDSQTYDIDTNFFTNKLNEFKEYEYWVLENFPDAIPIEYDELHKDVDSVLQKVIDVPRSIADRWKLSLQEYSKVRYCVNKYSQTKDPIFLFDKQLAPKVVALHKYICTLVDKKQLYSAIPIKMNTLQDKRRRVNNFDLSLDLYNSWAKDTNRYAQISQSEIEDRIKQEQSLYVNKRLFSL